MTKLTRVYTENGKSYKTSFEMFTCCSKVILTLIKLENAELKVIMSMSHFNKSSSGKMLQILL